MSKQFRSRLSSDEFELIKEIRNNHKALLKDCEDNGIPITDVKHYWHKSKHISMFVKNKDKNYLDIRDEIVAEMKQYSPSYVDNIYRICDEGHLLVIDPADIHIGKLCKSIETGDEYNHDIAVQRIMEGVDGLINKSRGFNIDKILLIIGNDILHVDTPKSTTTGGTFQDSSLMWYDAFTIAKKVYIDVIEKLIKIAPVHVQYDPSNHDYTNGFFLADTIHSWFSKSGNVTFNVTPAHRKYFQYYSTLIGTTHGDGAKVADLPLLMAQESAQAWVESEHRYFFTHHIHHKNSKDYGSVCVESLRSASGTDSWHHRNGYQHAPKAIEAFIMHKKHGQVARLTHIF